MAKKWIQWIKTAHKGLRYYEHQERKHGKKKDRYYAIRFKVDGKAHSYGIGWVSDGIPEEIRKKDSELGFEDYCLKLLRQYKGNAKIGSGPISPKDKRRLVAETEAQTRKENERLEKENITFAQYFKETYFPISVTSKKKTSYAHEEIHFRLWIDPVLGRKPLKEINSFDIERLKKKMQDAGRAPRTVQYVMATFRQVWNMARRSGIMSLDSPTKSVKAQQFDNRRQRFLSHAEADLLLERLREKDGAVYKIALLSLHTGMRASEIFHLTWGCIDTERGIITILDAKSGHGRAAFMTEQIKAMFRDMHRGKYDDRVFMQRKGIPYKEVPTLFRDIVKELGFNNHVSDSRQRVCFHSLRHSMASWHAEAGTDLYVIKELLGHGSIALTERYSHLSNGTLQKAAKTFEQSIQAAHREADKAVAGSKGGKQ